MDENDWLKSENPGQMLASVHERITARKQRLFACACVRSVWHNLHDERFRSLVELSEQYADGRVTFGRLDQATKLLYEVISQENFLIEVLARPTQSAKAAAHNVGHRLVSVCIDQVIRLTLLSAAPCVPLGGTEGHSQPDPKLTRTHNCHLADLVHDIVGNPFRSVSLHPDWLAWNNGTVGQLAETIYGERRYQDLPVLADALEEAGCDEAEILDHLRGPGVHARGCWALDLLLGKS